MSCINMKRAIITGATGAVGTAIIQALIQNEVEVLVLCREGSKKNDRIPNHKLVSKRYCSMDQLAGFDNPNQEEYDVFYHLAWEGTSGPGRDDMFLQNRNVKYALDAVTVAKRFGCSTFIGVGSQAEYGRVEGTLKPDTPTFPQTGYGIGKLTAGLMTREYAHQLGMRHIWTRILSIYGPNDGPQTMVMSTINALRKGEIPQLTKGEQIWDYLYSEDVGRAYALLGEKGVDGKTYVLGSGKTKKLREYVEEIRDVVSPGAELAFGAIPYYPHQVMYLQADVSELEKDTGWKAEMEFKDGIRIIMKRLNEME